MLRLRVCCGRVWMLVYGVVQQQDCKDAEIGESAHLE